VNGSFSHLAAKFQDFIFETNYQCTGIINFQEWQDSSGWSREVGEEHHLIYYIRGNTSDSVWPLRRDRYESRRACWATLTTPKATSDTLERDAVKPGECLLPATTHAAEAVSVLHIGATAYAAVGVSATSASHPPPRHHRALGWVAGTLSHCLLITHLRPPTSEHREP
jgi:Txe/YoeB family toxin of Txe-Axe toxin-antitoxin module